MKTPERRNNVRASARAARLEEAKARQEAERIEVEQSIVEAVVPTPPPIQEPGVPITPTEALPLEIHEPDLMTLTRTANVRYALAQRNEQVAQDHRLVLAQTVAAIKKRCEVEKQSFPKWVKLHFEFSAETARQMVRIGFSADPAAELAQIRSRNREANREHRKQKALAAPVIALPEAPPPPVPAWAEPVSHDAAPEDVAHGAVASEEVPVLLESDRLGNVLAGLRRLLVPDQVKALKVLAKDIPRESVIDALRTVGFVIVGFNLETAAE